MRNAMLSLLVLLALPAASRADEKYSIPLEVIHFHGSLSFLRCQTKDNATICHRDPVAQSPLEITLTDDDGFNGTAGEATLTAELDGFHFEAVVTVNKTMEKDASIFLVQAYVLSASMSEQENQSFDFIGSTIVKGEASRLGETIWVGRSVAGPDGSITPFVTIAP